MIKWRKGLLLVAAFLLSMQMAEAQFPVLLRATASEQNDSTGCNFVKELLRITYESILSGKVKMWDSPEKEIPILPTSLVQIEKSSETSFLDEEVLFIYEFWTNTNRDLKSTTQGFLFSNKSKTGEEVAYGYVDYNDLQEAFMRSRINVNANGNFNSNLASYLNSKNYNYKILQFAGKVITNAGESQKIKDDFIGTAKFNTTEFSTNEIPQKMVTWVLDVNVDPTAPKTIAGIALTKAIDDFLHNNPEVFLNIGGQNVNTKQQKGKWKVTKVQVTELWKKISGVVSSDPVNIMIYVNDSALAEIPYRDMIKYDITVGDKAWVDYIRLKTFSYYIIQINSQPVLRRESFVYQKALLTYDWNKITEFVKFY